MQKRLVPPEVALDLQIQLDRLGRLEQRCREGLRDLTEGRVTPDAYRSILEEHTLAQEAWQAKHRKYFRGLRTPAPAS